MSNPLDPAKAAFYGQFVKAVTAMYEADKTNLTPAPKDIPSGWVLEAWIDMTDFFFQITAPAFYGIVAHDVLNPDSRIIAIRGTEGLIEWFDDATSLFMVPFKQVPLAGLVAFGFDNIYSTLKVVPVPTITSNTGGVAAAEPALTGSFVDQLAQLAVRSETKRGVASNFAAGRTRPERPTVVTGHSLGSALATLFAIENSVKQTFDVSLLSTLASPQVGNLQFKLVFDALPITSWRIVNIRDAVPTLPPSSLGYWPVDVAYPFDSWPFAHQNEGCYHSIDTYLHWLNNSLPVSPDCALITTSRTV